MPLDFYASIEAELDFYGSTLGVDAVFVDCPVTALAWRNASQGFDDTIKPNDRYVAEPCLTGVIALHVQSTYARMPDVHGTVG